jgi:hypothetical protein
MAEQIPTPAGRRDYYGKSPLQRNSSHIALLGLLLFVLLIYFVLPVLSIPPPSVPDRVWELFALLLGIQKYLSGRADVELNKAAVSGEPAQRTSG